MVRLGKAGAAPAAPTAVIEEEARCNGFCTCVDRITFPRSLSSWHLDHGCPFSQTPLRDAHVPLSCLGCTKHSWCIGKAGCRPPFIAISFFLGRSTKMAQNSTPSHGCAATPVASGEAGSACRVGPIPSAAFQASA